MPLTQTAFLAKSNVPDRADLEAAIRAIGFDFSIDQFYKPLQCSGFLPCEFNGKKTGFEIYFGPPSEITINFPRLNETIGDRDCAITFRWGGDMAECASVLIVSAALAKSFGAVIHYNNDDMLYTFDQLLDDIKVAIGYMK